MTTTYLVLTALVAANLAPQRTHAGLLQTLGSGAVRGLWLTAGILFAMTAPVLLTH